MNEITGLVNYRDFVRKERTPFIQMIDALTSEGTIQEWFNTFIGFGYKGKEQVNHHLLEKKINGKTYAIVLSGVINNSVEVRRVLLEKGHRFHTEGDAEVALTAYIEWQERICSLDLKGDFTYAIWEDDKQSLYLSNKSRNRPVYYYEDASLFHFATVKLPLEGYKAIKNVHGNQIKELPFNSYLIFSKTGTHVTNLY
ncbi:hypothetical protein [Ornithinibacillus halotolerans]|uniref:asparagine synthase (glutamine-hydrolyzing) n=1 Tax=Ornithinibacillus halotolerans TaxID=1274357 RepID=A0A916RTT8_9BACI|nr:hypothetical protein [Ornithinibacillus halotolerans]GGA65913.1 hypothetical protein GCM10008025_07160 [Ornithinibacillus halotolerans]